MFLAFFGVVAVLGIKIISSSLFSLLTLSPSSFFSPPLHPAIFPPSSRSPAPLNLPFAPNPAEGSDPPRRPSISVQGARGGSAERRSSGSPWRNKVGRDRKLQPVWGRPGAGRGGTSRSGGSGHLDEIRRPASAETSSATATEVSSGDSRFCTGARPCPAATTEGIRLVPGRR